MRFHLERAEGPAELFNDNAVQMIFYLVKGLLRVMNQIAPLALIRAAIRRKDTIDEVFLKQRVLTNSVFDAKLDEG